MKTHSRDLMPQAREDGLFIKAVSDELLIYEVERHQVHCLNRAAALVWRSCDGKTTVSEAAVILGKELKSVTHNEAVWLALEELRAANLLHATATRKTGSARPISRRTLIQKLGVAAAVSLPIITSMVLPTAAAAQSVDCAAFTDQQSCENPLKPCGAQDQFFCRWRNVGGVDQCTCTNSL